ncbi:MAG TPA: ankyrin repeat domain-containing protein, partial [Candidatus Babeliaceae bacterium]|nr:ankyrin repeat domain-containing protein [Candidatus Babeliaceae bacterium]
MNTNFVLVFCLLHCTYAYNISKYEKWVKPVNQAIAHPTSSIKLLKALSLQAGGVFKICDKYQKHSALKGTPIHYAAELGKEVVINWFYKHGIPIDIKESFAITPLAQAKTFRTAQLLIKLGAQVNAQSCLGNTPLHRISYCGNIEVAKALLLHGAQVNIKGYENKTPLHCVTNTAMAQLLIDNGADVNAIDIYGKKPIHEVATSALLSLELLEVLLKAGAQINEPDN